MNLVSVIELLDFAILPLLLATAIAAVMVRNLVFSTVLLSIFSLFMALQYLVLGAPDVAITEAAVGAGISTILLLLVLSITGESEHSATGNFFAPIAVVVIIGGMLCFAATGLPPFGDPASPAHQHVVPYYLQKTEPEIGIPNVVTSVLASYRGFDTFGETTVIFAAAVSILLLLGKSKERKDGDDE